MKALAQDTGGRAFFPKAARRAERHLRRHRRGARASVRARIRSHECSTRWRVAARGRAGARGRRAAANTGRLFRARATARRHGRRYPALDGAEVTAHGQKRPLRALAGRVVQSCDASPRRSHRGPGSARAAARRCVWAAALIAAPRACQHSDAASPALVASAVVYGVGGVVCHQRAGSFVSHGRASGGRCVRAVPVCIVSAGLARAAAPLQPAAAWRTGWTDAGRASARCSSAAAPTAASWLGERLGLFTTGNMLRAALAVPLGLAVAVLMAYARPSAGNVRQLR